MYHFTIIALNPMNITYYACICTYVCIVTVYTTYLDTLYI